MTYRIESVGKNTGIALETTSGTHETLAAANFIGNWATTPISRKQTNVKGDVDGITGNSWQVNTCYNGEMSSIKVPFNYANATTFLQISGAKYNSTSKTFGIAGQYTSGSIVSKTLTVDQYDGVSLTSLYGSLASSCKLSFKVGEEAIIDCALKGKYQTSASSIAFNQTPDSTNAPAIFVGATTTLNSVAYDISDCEIDLGLKLTELKSATDATGFGGFVITDFAPKITLTAYPGSAVVFDTLWASDATFTFSMAFSTVTITAKCKVDTSDPSYSDGVKTNKITLTPLFDSTSGDCILFTFTA